MRYSKLWLFVVFLAELASDGLKGRVFEVSLADLQNDEQAFRKFRLISEDIQGKVVLTNFHGMTMTTDKLRSLVKKWQVSFVGSFATSQYTHTHVHLHILNKYKNNWIKLKNEVGMAGLKSTQTRDNRIYYTSLRLLFSIISYAPINVHTLVECTCGMWEIFRLHACSLIVIKVWIYQFWFNRILLLIIFVTLKK